MRKINVLLLLIPPFIFTSCHKKYLPDKKVTNLPFFETGFASFYADKFIGKPTASGQLYDDNKFTAAHRTIPFGKIVTVVNVNNGKTVKVVINDRGPFIANRIIDVSKAAAKALGMINAGVVSVRLTYQ